MENNIARKKANEKPEGNWRRGSCRPAERRSVKSDENIHWEGPGGRSNDGGSAPEAHLDYGDRVRKGTE